ncbi:MAG: tRNA (adenosine(37)-N6)-threonylcarbamoyltransferase complex dimerization subunit type 1 TsaB [bacterium]
MKILGIDTSSTVFSVGLAEDENFLYELKCERSFYKNTRDAGFFNTLKQIIDNLNNSRLDAIAITIGPGMFTSLRVGLAFAKGLYLSQHIPIYAVNTLDVIVKSFPASALKNNKIIIAPVINAFQNDIYVAFYNHHRRITKDLLMASDFFAEYVSCRFKLCDKIIAIGPGTQIIKQNKAITRLLKRTKNFIIVDSKLYYPSAANVITTSLPRIRKEECDNPELLEPYYIKKTAAEMKVHQK